MVASLNTSHLSSMAHEGSGIKQHPQSEYIKDRVDWWFSDENLKKDPKFRSLLISKGDENSVIHTHHLITRELLLLQPKPKPRQIVDALRVSKVVDIIDKEHVRRKIVFKGDDECEGGIWRYNDKPNHIILIPPHPGIKAGTYMKGTGTGFESGFIDSPITPKQYEEDRKLYDLKENDVVSRISYAIEGFVRRRKFTSRYQVAFGSFLAYGGIYPASRIGQGENDYGWEDEDLTKEQQYDIFAKFDLEWEDKSDGVKWEVDFEGVAKGYLSSQFDVSFDAFADQRIDDQCAVMSSFYNYLLVHDVCPEHTDAIKAALRITVEGAIQLKSINRLNTQLPSSFHKACLVLFDEEWKGIFGQEGDWLDSDTKVLRQNEARLIAGIALMAKAPASVYDAAYRQDSTEAHMECLALTEKTTITLEVVGVEFATENTRNCYHESGLAKKVISIGPLGELKCKFWSVDDLSEYDLPERLMIGVSASEEQTYIFWMEDDVLRQCFVGMKIKAGIRQLVVKPNSPIQNGNATADDESSPIWIIDTISAIYCSFYTFLINSMSTFRSLQPKFLDEIACFSCNHPLADQVRKHVYAERRNRIEHKERSEKEAREELEGVDSRKLEEKLTEFTADNAQTEASIASRMYKPNGSHTKVDLNSTENAGSIEVPCGVTEMAVDMHEDISASEDKDENAS